MIVLTPGEPAGVGLDLVVQLAQNKRNSPILVLCDPEVLQERAELLGLSLIVDANCESPSSEPQRITVLSVPVKNQVKPGVLDVANAKSVVDALDIAIEGCLGGKYKALVTGPVQKSVIQEAGFEFSGHTEYLADKSGVENVVMMLQGGGMRVALATTHLPIHRVAGALSRESIEAKLRIVIEFLQEKFLLRSPRILVSGLNPHAGERGHLGLEELEIIEPVCEALRKEGFDIDGPLPADTLFAGVSSESADAIFVMYHDQGLPVLKYASFGEAVNVTLGLPFIRTSVDHGTALDIAGSGTVDLGSTKAAIHLAERLSGFSHGEN